jgi:hypothetical protein
MLKKVLLFALFCFLITVSLSAADQKIEAKADNSEEYSDRGADLNDDGVVDKDEAQKHKIKKSTVKNTQAKVPTTASKNTDTDNQDHKQFNDPSLQKEKDKDDKVYKDVDRLQKKLNNT